MFTQKKEVSLFIQQKKRNRKKRKEKKKRKKEKKDRNIRLPIAMKYFLNNIIVKN